MNRIEDISSLAVSKANVVHSAPHVASSLINAALASLDKHVVPGVLTVDSLMKAAFFNGRAPRSSAYKAGTRMALEHRIERKDIEVPYTPGTADADAYFAGIEEGKLIYRVAVEKIGGAA